MWANIKCDANGLISYWVWIPRYAYNIDKDYSEIKVILVDINDKPIDTEKYGDTLSEYYTVHEMFKQGDGLEGVWFSKYEPTGTEVQAGE